MSFKTTDALLISCVDDQSIQVSGMLKFQLLFSHSVVSNPLWPHRRQHTVSLSFTISQTLLKFMSIELVMPSNHFIVCCPLLRLPSIFPSIRVFSSESTLHIKCLKYSPLLGAHTLVSMISFSFIDPFVIIYHPLLSFVILLIVAFSSQIIINRYVCIAILLFGFLLF